MIKICSETFKIASNLALRIDLFQNGNFKISHSLKIKCMYVCWERERERERERGERREREREEREREREIC